MKIAYLILAHNTPNHLKRMIKALNFQEDGFFIHIDKKSKLSDFNNIESNNVFFVNPCVPVYWGEFSQVRAILSVMRQALSNGMDYSYFVLLSGSDYPLRSAKYIHSFFEIHKRAEFINMVKMPNVEVAKPLSRLATYQVESDKIIIKKIFDISNKLLRRFGLNIFTRDYKKHMPCLDPYGGSTWWALTSKACQYILDFIDNRHNFVDFFENTICPDEMFFQTILGNSPFKKHVRRNITYADWSSPGRKPAVIEENHIVYFESSKGVVVADDAYGKGELLFARKFPDNGERLVERIDSLIIRNEPCR